MNFQIYICRVMIVLWLHRKIASLKYHVLTLIGLDMVIMAGLASLYPFWSERNSLFFV